MSLPIPPSALQVRSEQLVRYIRQAIIANQGAISFADYMQLALYTPGLGYYSGGLPKFGEAGDFITAPELSSLFGYCIAKQCAQVLAYTGGDILEFGAGSGKLALDVLMALQAMDSLPVRYLILEPSAELQQRQHELLLAEAPELVDKVSWLNQLPESFAGIILANEVLDAMPVHLVEADGKRLYERYVAWEHKQFTWTLRELNTATPLAKRLLAIQQLYGIEWGHYQTEINLMIPSWLNSIAQLLTQGLVLLIDYGFSAHEFYHPDRKQGTLMCHYRHFAHSDPFFYPGLQDITAHVDFTAVAEAAANIKMEIMGYTNQAAFLLNSGLLEALALYSTDGVAQFNLAQQVKKLTLPQEMGELFKVMALGKNLDLDLIGFSRQDQRHRL